MKILGIGPSMFHDPAAALLIDGKVVAAAEEERFIREKHATEKFPLDAIKYCLAEAGVTADEIDGVAFPWSARAYNRFKFRYFRRKFFNSPNRALKVLMKSGRTCRSKEDLARKICGEAGIDLASKELFFVEHHIAHAASAYYFSGFKEASVLSIDGSGEFTATFLGRGRSGKIETIKEICVPDSLGFFYSTLTEYIGFKSNNGEYKLMGMAPYGDASRMDFEKIMAWDAGRRTYKCNDAYVWVKRSSRYDTDKMYSKRFVEEFGLPRKGDGLEEPYVHIAAETQKRFEKTVINLVKTYLKEDLLKHGNLVFAGGCALNVALNRVLLEEPYIKNLWVQPAAHDAGSCLGAAAYVAVSRGDKITPMKDVYLGPEYKNEEIEKEIKKSGFSFTREKDITRVVADLLAEREIVGWFQGRMEWGPRALGNRSILGNPDKRETADRINNIIKFREPWRPFCPSILKDFADKILSSDHPAPFMAIAFKVKPEWKKRVPAVVHVDGTCRPQIVEKETNPRFYTLIENFYGKTGLPAVINTSLNRRGEPMVCSPRDALVMFRESGLQYLAIGDFLVKKTPVVGAWLQRNNLKG